jgi:hypothetical protein
MGASTFESFEHDWDAAVDIGSSEPRQALTLTRIATTAESDGVPVFLEEIAAEKGTFPRSLRYRRWVDGEIEGRSVSWMRLEVRVASKLLPKSDSGCNLTLVVTAPNASGWVHTAPFRISNKKHESEREDPLWKPAVDDAEIITRTDETNYDFWENDDYWTAGISDPGQPGFEEVRRNTTTAWHYGIVENYDQVVAGLHASAEVVRLLDLTDNGTLRFWPTHLPNGKSFSDEFKMLHSDTKESSNWLMMLAVRQALAGGGKDVARWSGQPVVGLVEQCYKDLVCFYNRKTIEGEIKELRLIQLARDYADSQKPRAQRVRKRPSRDS